MSVLLRHGLTMQPVAHACVRDEGVLRSADYHLTTKADGHYCELEMQAGFFSTRHFFGKHMALDSAIAANDLGAVSVPCPV